MLSGNSSENIKLETRNLQPETLHGLQACRLWKKVAACVRRDICSFWNMLER